jgi:hypothetical protein
MKVENRQNNWETSLSTVTALVAAMALIPFELIADFLARVPGRWDVT